MTKPSASAHEQAVAGPRITRLLIANRGEIARRIMRTAQARGIACVAVFSEADADAPFVRAADFAYALRGVTSAESYLDTAQILAAAEATGADAVHPGYGFLSENADFARMVTDAGLIWVGPTPESIIAMSGKVAAKRLVAAAGVPLLPGAELDGEALTGGESDDSGLLAAADAVGYPLLVKASAGGGGKGMRVVDSPAELVAAVAGARREAAASFGDPTVFLERYVVSGRHIEVQIFGDTHGNVVHLLERECSIQRRHQKVVEEAPAPFLSVGTRAGLHAASVAAAKAIDYVGAGTVEFLVDGDDFYFLEMNTRLQVEHPVTEEILDIDLVGWQLDVAQGARLPEVEVVASGHAIEVRLYAEDPANGDLPSTGELQVFDISDPRLRVESGVESGSVVSQHYDPMLAKVIAHGADRESAAAILASGLRAGRIHGVTTNRAMLVAILESPSFLDTASSTAFLLDHPQVRAAAPGRAVAAAHAAAAAAALRSSLGAQVPTVALGAAGPGWRNVGQPDGESWALAGEWASLLTGADEVEVRCRRTYDGDLEWGFSAADEAARAGGAHDAPIEWLHGLKAEVATPLQDDRDAATISVRVTTPERLAIRAAVTVRVDHGGERTTVFVDDNREHSVWILPSRFPDADDAAAGAGPATPVPGTITHVAVAPGDRVTVGDVLVILEAMKMEHRITADADADVAEVLVAVGDSVEAHQVVVVLAAHTQDEGDQPGESERDQT